MEETILNSPGQEWIASLRKAGIGSILSLAAGDKVASAEIDVKGLLPCV
jgi:hypothetical protein